MGTDQGRHVHALRQRVRPYPRFPSASRSEERRLAIQEEEMFDDEYDVSDPYDNEYDKMDPEEYYPSNTLDDIEGPTDDDLREIELEGDDYDYLDEDDF